MCIRSKCTKLIRALSKSAKQRRGLSHAALYTIYEEAILPLLFHSGPIWIEEMEKESNKTFYNRIQRLINIKIAKVFLTSNEALCTLTGLTPLLIKAEETAKLYNIKRKFQAHEFNHEVQPKHWFHPADSDSQNKTRTLYKYTQTEARASPR
jgi:hypothetical protein